VTDQNNVHDAADDQAPGLDLERLSAWFPTAVPNAAGELSARLIAGGKSNLTYEVSDGHRRWIVRRPPLGHVLATAHDVAREFRVMGALQPTAVPVPETLALCADEEVIGAAFCVLEYIEGTPYRKASELAELGPERTRAISSELVDILGNLHAVDPRSIGLEDFGRAEGFLGRQVGRWKKQMDASRTRELPLADELHARLEAALPPTSDTAIVHGDYRLDNLLVDHRDRALAVIDWEMATLGDPLTDLALLVVYQRLGNRLPGAGVVDASSAPGFLDESEIVDRYAERTGRDLTRIGFHLGLASFKLAAIVEGIHFRHLSGQTVGAGFENIGDSVNPLLETGLASLKENF
jgi:aminoglycoside phosphotransferase (APT) family kinase protein